VPLLGADLSPVFEQVVHLGSCIDTPYGPESTRESFRRDFYRTALWVIVPAVNGSQLVFPNPEVHNS
jgi:hypothetical protein